MPPEPPPPLRLRLDKPALATNWRAVDRMSGEAGAGAAVKADAYGLGASRAVPVLREAGCRDWFVAHWGEVSPILPLVRAGDIAVLHGPMNDEDVAFARATGVRPVLNSLDQVQRWLDAGGGACDVMVDTGMSRLGLPMEDIGDPRLARLDVTCCHSHLASADEDVAQNAEQLARFREARGRIAAARYSLANSAAIALGPDYHFDLTRPGLALYGGIPRGELGEAIAQVVRPEAAVIQVRNLGPGDRIGYNATFIARRQMRVGIVSVGYADGYMRCWSNKGSMRWRGESLPVVGRVSMDMTVVDLGAAGNCGEGDWLEIDYSLPEAAAASGLSQYELLTVLGSRFLRE